MIARFRARLEAWAGGPEPILGVSPGWPRGFELAAAGMLGFIVAAAWLPGARQFFALRPGLPLALLAVACAYGLGVNALDAARRFTPPAVLGSAVVYGALVQLAAWSLVLCAGTRGGALVLANGPILVAASHALRLRPTLRFPWPLAGHVLGGAAAYAAAAPEHRTLVVIAGPLSLIVGLLLGRFAERLRRAEREVAEHVDAIRARELEARATELTGLSATLLELMQRGHDARSALSGALLDAEQLEQLAPELPGAGGHAAASLRATLERLRERIDTRSGLLSSRDARRGSAPSVRVAEALDAAVASAQLRAPWTRILVHAAPEARDVRARVAGGEAALRRMVEILLENGCQGDGRGRGSRVDVAVSVEEHTGALAIAVQDDGPGFRPELLARLLAPFQTTKPGTLGLGLYTAERLARASGGSLRRENLPGGGARVTLFLELAASEEPASAAEHGGSGNAAPAHA